MAQLTISAATMEAIAAAAALLMLLSLGASAAPPAADDDPSPPTIGMPNCVTSCADVLVPYPFGLGTDPSCYLPGYNLTCDITRGDARLLLDVDGTFQVLYIGDSFLSVVRQGDIKIHLDADGNGNGMLRSGLRHDVPLTLQNYGQSELILTGCNVQATVKCGNITVASCTSLCGRFAPAPIADDGSVRCSGGTGCCHGDVMFDEDDSSSTSGYDVQLTWLGHGNRSADLELFPMRVFIANTDWFANGSISNDLLQTSVPPSEDTMAVPLFLFWEIVGEGHHCNSNHSERMDARKGYICTCKQGFRGNPYLIDGCKAVNECDEINWCYGECINKDGISTCRCPPGTIGNYAIPGGCLAIVADTDTANCMTSCGGVTVPYPFGMGPSTSCYLPGFDLTCNTSHHPPQLLLGNAEFQVVNISLANSTMRVIRADALISAEPSMGTWSWSFGGDMSGGSQFFFPGEAPYSLSTRNELVVTGCNAQATLLGHGNPTIMSGCASFCSSNDNGSSNGLGGGSGSKYCHGMGCCQARISESVNGMPKELIFKWFDTSKLQDLLPLPGYTFIAEEGWFEQQGSLIMQKGLDETTLDLKVPILLGWEVLHNGSSANSRSRRDCPGEVARALCKSEHSQCKRGNRGHTCKCNDGYHGNPYIIDGCRGGLAKYFRGEHACYNFNLGQLFLPTQIRSIFWFSDYYLPLLVLILMC
ncbi:unnamed protein product [Triticum turgidum subsp. durum]|uniref:Wall-associated receptor kinase galacturonan-binding domain-containing protein n=1 Tax=Triticum turgidum subsp. durum TaxID=4567 RepID=A0A9R0YEZ5_TRITD|nr:unnamed protein product [Triticum turgidum subsp. durum]